MKNKITVIITITIVLMNIIIPSIIFNAFANEQEAKIIEKGIYRISRYGNGHIHEVIEIEKGSKNVTANVEIGTWKNIDNEKNKFEIIYDNASGYYTIKNIKSGNMLDVQNGGMEPGTNVWQHKPNGTDAQKWKIEKNLDGSYSFKSKKNGLYLNVNKENIEVNKKNNSEGQKFEIMSLDKKPEKVIENGIYKIGAKTNENNVIQIKNESISDASNVEIGNWNNNTNANRFEITYKEDGYYEIKNIKSGKLLDAQNGGMNPGTNVWQYGGNYTDAQRWKIEKNSDGTYAISNKKSGLYLNNKNGNIELTNKKDEEQQKFKISQVEKYKPINIIENGIYRISRYGKDHIHEVIEIEKGSKNVTANVEIGTWKNIDNEKNKFEIIYDNASGYYTIKNIKSGNMLDVQNGGMNPGTNVWQHKPNGTDAQKWKIEKNQDGSYSFVSKKNGLYLNTKNNNIEVNKKNNSQEQKFELISLDKKPAKTIENGTYKIETKTNSSNVIQIKDNSTSDAANAEIGIWTNYMSEGKKFEFTYKEDGYYEIKNIKSGKLIDAQNGGMNPGTNVWQYGGNYTDAQRWKIEKNSDGTYSISNKKNGLYLNNKNGNIELTNTKSQENQKFNIVDPNKIKEEDKIAEGTYKIVVASNPNLSIHVKNKSKEVGANIELGNVNEKMANEFNIVPVENGCYEIINIHSGNVLDVQNGGMTPYTNVWQHKENGTDAQKWYIEHNKNDDTYSIISKKNGLFIDVLNGQMKEGANIQVCTPNGTNAQKFKLIKQTSKTEKIVEDKTYKILTKLNSKIGFDIESASKENGGILQIWNYEDVPQQQFEIRYHDGYYYIININSDKAMQAVGNQIKQYTLDYGNENQKWIIKENNGYYSMIAKINNLCITIPNNNTKNGTDLVLQKYTRGNNQQFSLGKIEFNINENKYPNIKGQLESLKRKHPNWNFEILYTGLDFNYVVNEEYQRKRNCLVNTNTYQGEWIAKDPYKSGAWYSASYNGIAYFMDPRNFINEIDIFQFLDLNKYERDSVTLQGIQEEVKGTFLNNYAKDINNACVKQNVNPYYVIARLFQEQGRKGTTIGTGMDGKDGKTYYNPFNIGAQVGNDYETALAKAKEKGWDSMEKAIVGGIDFLKEAWLENYQNTLYQNKFDIDTRNGSSLFTHEYMQNLSAAYSEARILRDCYAKTNKTNSNFTFIIPVYENMPREISKRPSNKSVNIGPQDAKVVNVDSVVRIREDANTNSNVLKEIKNGTHLVSIERAINGNWNHVVTDDGIIGYVSGDYLQIVPDIVKCNIKKTVKVNSGVNIRLGPSTNTRQIGRLSQGTEVRVINEKAYNIGGYEWDRVVLNDGRQGFIASEFLK